MQRTSSKHSGVGIIRAKHVQIQSPILTGDLVERLASIRRVYPANIPLLPQETIQVFPDPSAQPQRIYAVNLDLCSTLGPISDDLVAVHAFEPTTVSEHPIALTTLTEPITVTENLFNSILPVRLFGMNYADRHWEEFSNPQDVYGRKPGVSSQLGQNTQKLKKRKRKNGIEPPPPSFWDQVYALLQPTIILDKPNNSLLPHELYPYQRVGINFLLQNESALLADDMGTGKTVMTTVALKILIQKGKLRRALILCPPSILYEWQKHLSEWAPELIFSLVRGNPEDRAPAWKRPAHVYLTTYDVLKRDIKNSALAKDITETLELIVLDEAHHVKNSKSDRARAIKRLSPQVRWALTGTPVQNQIEDMVALFEILRPGYLMPEDAYLPSRVMNRVKPYFLRRRKQEVMPDLPAKVQQQIWLELDLKQRAVYERVANAVRSDLEAMGDKVTKQAIFAKITTLKQICNFASLEDGTSPKVSQLKDDVEEILASGQKVLVFSQFLDEGIYKIQNVLDTYGTSVIIGGQSDTERRRNIELFKYSKDVSILIISVRSGGEGLNLTEASYVIHFDHWWNPAVMWQAEDRAHRRGQMRGVNVYSYWMKDTIEEQIYETLQRKGMLFENVVDGLATDVIDDSISEDEWLAMLGVQRVRSAQELNRANWQAMSIPEITDRLLDLTPNAFEQLVQQLMHYWGYSSPQVVGRAGDGGIDVIATRRVGQIVETVAAQCKRYKDKVGVETARELLGALHDRRIPRGFLITTSDFTAECLHFCEKHGIRAVAGSEIAMYIKRSGIKL